VYSQIRRAFDIKDHNPGRCDGDGFYLLLKRIVNWPTLQRYQICLYTSHDKAQRKWRLELLSRDASFHMMLSNFISHDMIMD